MEKNTTPISILAQGFTLYSFITEFVSQLITNPNQPLDQFYKNFESKMRVPHLKGKNVIFTPGSLLGLLYLMIVFPQQKLKLKDPEQSFDSLLKEWGIPEPTMWNDNDNGDLETFIKRLRNSVSHGRVQFDDSMNITFEDAPINDNKRKNKKKGKVDFCISMSVEDLKKFTENLARSFKFD